MGYTEYSEMGADLSAEEMEDIRADIERICDVAQAAGIALDRSVVDYIDDAPEDIISLNGVGDEACEPLVIRRYLCSDIYGWGKTFTKTYRRDYTPVVQAALMALKQRVPEKVQISSDGEWDWEWLHGVDCRRSGETKDDPSSMGGRRLYALAFPDTPTTKNVFRSPLEERGAPDVRFYIPREVRRCKNGSGFDGVPFGVTLWSLLKQAERHGDNVCFVCGAPVATRVETRNKLSSPTNISAPMCSFCFRERLESGELLGYKFARFPYVLVPTPLW
ncbi:MAG: hypothetical protein OXI16_13745 [Chloroflexota bacterium]|nr:hypothetical protein [Chloroflexota bacterium]